MTPATTPTPAPAPAPPRRRKPGRAVLLHGVPWQMYSKLLKVFEGKRGVKLTYDRGELEIMAPSFPHEGDGEIFTGLIRILTAAAGLPVRSGGSTTLKKKRLMKGLEPDKCYWIANAAKVIGMRVFDPKVYPPPDLAIEVDVTRSSLNRMGIYARLGVPELWRLDGDVLRFYALGPRNVYAEVATSPVFAGLAPADLMAFVGQARSAVDENVILDGFRNWVRQRVAAPPAP